MKLLVYILTILLYKAADGQFTANYPNYRRPQASYQKTLPYNFNGQQNNFKPLIDRERPFHPSQGSRERYQGRGDSLSILEHLSPGALNSIINPGAGSANNVIGNTAYNTFGNTNSFVQNNPQ